MEANQVYYGGPRGYRGFFHVNRLELMLIQAAGFRFDPTAILDPGPQPTTLRGRAIRYGVPCVVKFIPVGPPRQGRLNMPRDLAIMRQLNHPNVLRVFWTFRAAEWGSVPARLLVFMEDCAHWNFGTLNHHLAAHPEVAFAEPVAASLYLQMASALQYIHSLEMFHGDIKLENILVAGRHPMNGPFTFKLIGFGMAPLIENPGAIHTSYPFMSPDLIDAMFHRRPMYDGQKADCFALGVLVYLLLNRQYPFHPSEGVQYRSQGEAFADIQRQQTGRLYPFPNKQLAPGAMRLVNAMLEPDAEMRPTMDELLEYEPWPDRD